MAHSHTGRTCCTNLACTLSAYPFHWEMTKRFELDAFAGRRRWLGRRLLRSWAKKQGVQENPLLTEGAAQHRMDLVDDEPRLSCRAAPRTRLRTLLTLSLTGSTAPP
jgi:hypothetical protein